MKAADFTFYNNADYFRQLARDVAATKWGDRVAVATMTFNTEDHLVRELLRALNLAAKRGVDVQLAVDARTFLVSARNAPGPLAFSTNLNRKLSEPYQSDLRALQTLKENGGQYVITNLPKHAFSQAASGRSHIKTATVNDKVFIGGCNIEDSRMLDVMVSLDDRHLAAQLYKIVSDMVRTGQTQEVFHDNDLTLDLDESTQVLIDSGKRGQSVILDQAFRVIDEAREWIYLTCQFYPGGETVQHLRAAAKRGVKIELVFSHPSAMGLVAPLHYAHMFYERLHTPKEFFVGKLSRTTPKLHAKVLATEKSAMVGSHNYVTQGVTFGTAEIALLRHDAVFSVSLREFIKNEIQRTA